MSALTEREQAGGRHFNRTGGTPLPGLSVSKPTSPMARRRVRPPRSVSAFSFLAGWWEYALAGTLTLAAWTTGSGWFVVGLMACFLLACRRSRVASGAVRTSGSRGNTSLLNARKDGT